jgi:hypothetical protein
MTSDAVVTVEIRLVQFDVDRNFVFGIVLSYLDDKKSKRNGLNCVDSNALQVGSKDS